jgi:phosphoribosylaminoimidazolecarboxamide formyltransferase/IMP cyclohydrolase
MAAIKRALLATSNKTGLVEFARALHEMGVELVSTGGTQATISAAGVPVRHVSELTGFPEMMDGRVRTLHPKIHGGLLALRDNPEHMETAREHGIELIDLVVVNLYPFRETVAKPEVTLEDAIENIDIGGPSMLRSAAKNYRSVTVVCDPARYPDIVAEMKANGGEVTEATRRALAVEAFGHTAAYDDTIWRWLSEHLAPPAAAEAGLPDVIEGRWEKVQETRYGENPHQRGAFYRDPGQPRGLATMRQRHGIEMSFLNYFDTDAALAVVRDLESAFGRPAAGIIKHATPCGAAVADTLEAAFRDALASDPLSAFGGIIGLSRPVDLATAEAIREAGLVHIVAGPAFEAEAFDLLSKRKSVRLLEFPDLAAPAAGDLDFKRVAGGILAQDRDEGALPADLSTLKQVTRPATPQEMASLAFAWRAVKHVKSNAIVLADGTKTVGIGGGQTSRVDAAMIAVRHAGERARGSVMASDAFIPHPDTVEVAAEAGVTAIMQPGGSDRDEDAFAVAREHKIAMVLTGMRHFRH